MKTHISFSILLIALLLMPGSVLLAQDAEEEPANISFDLGIDITSRYIWRGMALSTSPALQPYSEFAAGDFTIGAWGSYTIAQEPAQEVDLYITYSKSIFRLSLLDYYIPAESAGVVNDFFDYDVETTSHALEALLEISDIPGLPLGLKSGIMVYGDDLNEDGNQNYSAYIEANLNFSIGQTDLQLFAGLTPAAGLYADDFAFVNTGIGATKEIPVTEKFSLPVSSALIINPDAGDIFLTFTISF